MKPTNRFHYVLAFLLSLALTLPNSALALRVSQEGDGLEELREALAPAAGLEELPWKFSIEALGPIAFSFILSPNGKALYADVSTAALPKEGWRTPSPPRYLARLSAKTLQVEKRTALMDSGSSLLPNLDPSMSGLAPLEALKVIEAPGTYIGRLFPSPDSYSLYIEMTDTEQGTHLLRLDPKTFEIQATGPAVSNLTRPPFSWDAKSLYVEEATGRQIVPLDPLTLAVQSEPFPRAIRLLLTSPYRPELFGLEIISEAIEEGAPIPAHLVRLDPATFHVLARSSERFHVTDIHFAVSPDGSTIYNQGFGSEQLLRMDPKTLEIERRGPTLGRAAPVLLSSDGKTFYTQNPEFHLLRLDPVTLEIEARGPHVLYNIQLATGENAVYALDGHRRLLRLDPRTLEVKARFDEPIR